MQLFTCTLHLLGPGVVHTLMSGLLMSGLRNSVSDTGIRKIGYHNEQTGLLTTPLFHNKARHISPLPHALC